MNPEQETERQTILTLAYSSYEKSLNAYALYKVNDDQLVKDLVQDTFMKTWLYLVRCEKIDTIKGLLYHILNHLIIDQYRKHKTTSLDLLVDRGFEPKLITENLWASIDAETALGLIPSLPSKYGEILDMRYIQNLSLKEIADITGQSKNTVAVQIHRGIEKLKAMYDDLQNNTS